MKITDKIIKIKNKITGMSDILNPFLIKEIRQSLKSKLFQITIILTALTCAVILLIGLVQYDNSNSYGKEKLGMRIFAFVYILLWIIVVGVFPVMGGIRFYSERHTGEFELFEITGIKPGQIILGKLQSSLVFSLLIISISSPFLMLNNFFQGISTVEILFYIILLIFVSIGTTVLGILIGSLKINKILMTIINIVFITILIGMSYTVFYFIFSDSQFHVTDIFNVGTSSFYFFIVIISLFIFYFPLFLLSAKSALTSTLENGSINLKLFFLILSAFILLATGLYHFIFKRFFPVSELKEIIWVVYYALILVPIGFVQFGIFAAVDHASLKVNLKYKKGIKRIFKFIFYPGEGSLRIWFSIILTILFIFECYFIYYQKSYFDVNNLTICISLILLYSTIGVFINRFFKKVAKLKIHDIIAAIAANVFVIIVIIILGIATNEDDIMYFLPFRYLTDDINYLGRHTQIGLLLLVPVIIALNTLYGLMLFIRQLTKEKKILKLNTASEIL